MMYHSMQIKNESSALFVQCPAMLISENYRGSLMLNLWFLIPFLPYNAIGIMLKFEIVWGRVPP